MSNSLTSSNFPFLLILAYNAICVYDGPLWTSDPPALLQIPPIIEAPIDVEPMIE